MVQLWYRVYVRLKHSALQPDTEFPTRGKTVIQNQSEMGMRRTFTMVRLQSPSAVHALGSWPATQ